MSKKNESAAGPVDSGPAPDQAVSKGKGEGPADQSKVDQGRADQGRADQGKSQPSAAPRDAATSTAVVDGATAEASPAGADTARKPLAAELEALRSELDERLRDLQRVTAEYANYRKRVERDRGLMAEQATGLVIATLLPILDDLDRARDHGDLVGPFGAVADQLVAALGKFGLNAFGEVGDRFDPTRHEAVTHETKADVTEPTCTTVMRRGYLLGDRLLRPALVAVADPE